MLKLLSVVTFLFLFSVQIHAQVLTQDSRGKDVFEYYKGGTLAGTFSPTQISMQVNYNFVLGSPYYFYVKGDTVNGRTISGSHALSVTGKVTGSGTNWGKPLNVAKELVRPAYRLELGYQRTIDKFDSIELVPSPFAYTAGIVSYVEFQNVNFYDTLKDVQVNEHPLIWGLHGHATFFNHSGRYALSFSGDVGSTYNQDPLIPYQARSSTIIDPNVVSQGDLLGYIGTYEKLGNYRVRFSLPIYITKAINLTPYAAVHGYMKKNSNFIPGIALNLFNGSPLSKTLGQGFGLGLDWVKTKNDWSKPNYFIYGSLNLELLRKIRISRLRASTPALLY